jgi:hypothetical protein
MSSIGAALAAAYPSSARAEASRRNGARSCGPRTPEGKARSSQNALKHGLRAQKFVVVGDEKAAEFAALEEALVDELAPAGALQGLLAARIARAAWRLERAERIEAELFERHADRGGNLGLALIRDGNGAGAFGTLLRYRGTALGELWRALRLLKALQAEAAHAREVRDAIPQVDPCAHEKPIEPDARETEAALRDLDADAGPDAEPGGTGPGQSPAPAPRGKPPAEPIEPEGRRNPGEIISRGEALDKLQAAPAHAAKQNGPPQRPVA